MRRLTGFAAALALVVLVSTGCAPASSISSEGAAKTEELPSYTDADLQAWHEENLESVQRELGIEDPPTTEVVRYVEQQEWAQAQVTCLKEAGFDAVESGGGMDLTRVPEEQKGPNSPLYRAVYQCQAEYPVDPRYSVAPNRAQLEVMYAYFVDDLIPCLEAQGVDGIDEAPSRSSFVEESQTEGRVVWSPYADDHFLSVSAQEWQRLDALCPSQAPLDLLWR